MPKKLTKKQEEYLINKYMSTQGGLKPKNVSVELKDGYGFGKRTVAGKEYLSIIKK